ncbi:MAG: hypothetical protein ABSD27_13915 [Bryobacteraceae bacterium]|jgi:hypothetical protein
MRRLRLGAAAVSALLIWSAGACKRRPPQVETVEDENQPALSVVPVAHPRAAPQLLNGFHQVEENSWRWTMGRFAVAVQPPPGSSERGARLELRFSLPDSVVSRRGPVTLSAWVEGTALPPQTYAQAGEHTYARDVPPEALRLAPARVSFALDKFLRAGEIEARELGLVVTSVGLAPK